MADSLNGQYEPTVRYRAVVEHGQGLLVVVAGPGTGKTYSLLRKIESLIDLGIDPSQIYYLTFVNSIVDAFISDIRKPKEKGGLGVDAEELGIHISTLHSLAFKIVKVYSTELRLPEHMEVIDLSPKPQSLLSQIFLDDLYVYSKTNGITENKRSFYRLLRPLTEAWRANNPAPSDCETLAEAIELLCRKYEVCPWDKLVLYAIQAIQENGLPTWLNGAQHFLIDEYQDFNPSEQRLIELITEPSDSVVIVGDPDQSIYSGRSASPEGLLSLLERSDAKAVNFVFCRRCPKRVVAAANNLLKFMDEAGYSQKELQAFKDQDGQFGVRKFKSCKAEVEELAGILKALDESKIKDAILLLPKRNVAEYYVKKLSEAGVSCTIKSADAEAELREAIFRLILLHHQPFLNRVLLSLFQNIEKKFRDQVLCNFVANEVSLIDALTQISAEKKWQKKQRASLSEFKSANETLMSNEVESIIGTLESLDIKASSDFINCLLNSDPDRSARDRITTCMGETAEEDQDSADEIAGLQIMTMHSSKGLSKQVVIIPAFEEKVLPGDNEGERLKEMHRLVYVAVTRAKGQVIITFPKTRARGDPLNYGARPRLSRYADILSPTI